MSKSSRVWTDERLLFRFMFTLRGLAVEFPEVPKCLRIKSLIELNAIYPYPTRRGVPYTRLFHRQPLWKIGSKSLNLKQCTPVTLPPTRNLAPEEELPVSVCQGEQIGSNGLAWEMAALLCHFLCLRATPEKRKAMSWIGKEFILGIVSESVF